MEVANRWRWLTERLESVQGFDTNADQGDQLSTLETTANGRRESTEKGLRSMPLTKQDSPNGDAGHADTVATAVRAATSRLAEGAGRADADGQARR